MKLSRFLPLSLCLLVCLGDAAVGKSALSHMFHSDGTLFQKNYSMVRALTRRVAGFIPAETLSKDPQQGHAISRYTVIHTP